MKTVLITGASSGIGKSTALRLLEEGYIVYGVARSVDKMKDIQKKGGKVIPLDITNHKAIEKCVKTIIEEQGSIDVLVNNAGFGLYGTVEETSIEDARYQFEVNLFGLAKLTQLVIPHMRKQKSGTIVNISSVGGKIYTPLGAWYHATKHALEGWSDCLRLEVSQFDINVVIVEPGLIQTAFGDVLMDPMMKRSGKGPYKQLAKSVSHTTKKSYTGGEGSSPDVITKVISKALKAKTPRTRYSAGKFAKSLLFLRKYVSDTLFDKIIMSQVK